MALALSFAGCRCPKPPPPPPPEDDQLCQKGEFRPGAICGANDWCFGGVCEGGSLEPIRAGICRGDLAPGAACTNPYACRSGYTCISGTCQIGAPAGGICSTVHPGTPCIDGTCENGRCRRRQAAGAICYHTAGAGAPESRTWDCADGMFCGPPPVREGCNVTRGVCTVLPQECSPGASRCHEGQREICNDAGRWERRPCTGPRVCQNGSCI